jgi:hypothetical protein
MPKLQLFLNHESVNFGRSVRKVIAGRKSRFDQSYGFLFPGCQVPAELRNSLNRKFDGRPSLRNRTIIKLHAGVIARANCSFRADQWRQPMVPAAPQPVTERANLRGVATPVPARQE